MNLYERKKKMFGWCQAVKSRKDGYTFNFRLRLMKKVAPWISRHVQNMKNAKGNMWQHASVLRKQNVNKLKPAVTSSIWMNVLLAFTKYPLLQNYKTGKHFSLFYFFFRRRGYGQTKAFKWKLGRRREVTKLRPLGWNITMLTAKQLPSER